jgi:carbon-monoxide dehydrogenase medium subunit
MKPPLFNYLDPATVEEAVAILAEHGDDAKVLAGGQSLMPMLSMRLAYPDQLVDINGVAELDGIHEENGGLRIGALTRHSAAEASELVGRACPLIAKGMPWIGHRAIRNRGTLGGSLAHADPAAELPAIMTALEATVIATRAGGEREIALGDLFEMPLVSALAPEELLTEIHVPAQPVDEGSALVELARRQGDFAVAGIVATLTLGAGGAIDRIRLVAFAVAPVPVRLVAAEEILAGADPGGDAVAEAARAAAGDVSPTSDLHGTAVYRRALTAELLKRAVAQAVADARARSDHREGAL